MLDNENMRWGQIEWVLREIYKRDLMLLNLMLSLNLLTSHWRCYTLQKKKNGSWI